MLQSLFAYTNMMHHTIKKTDVIKNLDNTLNALSDDVVPALEGIIANAPKDGILNDNSILSMIRMTSDIKAKDNRELLVKIKGVLVNISKSGKDFSKVVDSSLSDIVTDKTATVRDLAILKVVTDISGMVMFVLDLSYLVLTRNGTAETNYPKKKFEDIKAGVPSFSSSLNAYGEKFSGLIKDLPKVSDNNINVDQTKISMFEKLVAKSGKMVKLPTTQGFINNPIYHVRMWFVDREISKYESLKDKKKLIDLKLMELKLAENGESNEKLAKQIEYYEEKISKIEYEISKIEDGI